MRLSKNYYAETARTYAHAPLEQGAVLLLEDYSGQRRGDVAALAKWLVEQKYASTVYYALPTMDVLTEDIEQLWNEEKIRIVRNGSLNFWQALETAEYVVTSRMVPANYVRREGQKVACLLPEYTINCGESLNRKQSLLQQTFAKSDLFWADSDYTYEQMRLRFPKEAPFRLERGGALRDELPSDRTAEVIFSLTGRRIGKLYSHLEAKVQASKLVCISAGRSLVWRIPAGRCKQYEEENQPEVLDLVTTDLIPLNAMTAETKVVVTDRISDVSEAVRLRIPCVYITNLPAGLFDVFDAYQDMLYPAYGWDNALKVLEELLQDLPAETVQTKTLHAVGSACEAFWSVLQGMEPVQQECEELLIMAGSSKKALLEATALYRRSHGTELLLRGANDGLLWDELALLPDDCRAFVRLNTLPKGQKDEEGNVLPPDYSEQAMQDDWKCMIGNTRYQKMLVYGGLNEHWESLLKYAPAREVRVVEKENFLDELFCGLENPFLTEKHSMEELWQEDTLDSMVCYRLGGIDSDAVWLKKKSSVQHPAVAFVHERKDVEKLTELADAHGKGRTIFLIDPENYAADSALAARAEVYRLPANYLPMRVYLAAEEVWNCADYVIAKTAAWQGKTLRGKAVKDLKVRFTGTCCLLSASSADELIPLEG